MSWGPGKLLLRCSKESIIQQRVGLWAPGWASGERERHNVDGHKSGGQNIAVAVQSPTPSHTQTLSNPFRTLTIKWEVHIFIKKSSCVFIIVSLWCCRWRYNNMHMHTSYYYWLKIDVTLGLPIDLPESLSADLRKKVIPFPLEGSGHFLKKSAAVTMTTENIL